MSEPTDTREDELGALWENESTKGGLYMTGKINGVPVVVFKNRQKRNDKHPDWRVLKARPRPIDDDRDSDF